MKILDLCLPHSGREHAIDGPRDILPTFREGDKEEIGLRRHADRNSQS